MTTDRQENELLKIKTSLGPGKFVIDDLRGEEHLSGLFRYDIELHSEEVPNNWDTLVGTKATIFVQGTDAVQRHIHGVFTRFSIVRVDPVSRHAFFQAELRPWTWLLGLQSDSRIFQNKTVPEIISTVFGDAGFSDYRQSLSGSYQPREYCVQYRESNLNFVCRLMEEEGIFFYFEHEADKHTLVLGDDADAHQPCPNGSTLRYRSNVRSALEEDIISEVACDQHLVSGAYGVNSFNFETPTTSLFSKVQGQDNQTLALHDFPVRHVSTEEGEKIAKRRLEAIEVGRKLLRGGGQMRTLTAGYKFTLSEHEIASLNTDWVVRSLRIRASRADYRVDFVAFPATVPFRPLEITPKPVIPSTQTAIVVGKSGEEQWVDSHGRVKVQFHWDRQGQKDENSSCWIRVAQGWAGKSWGMVFLPRIGQEVVVSFLEGDPDRPLITGAVYNGENTPPYALPAEQTKSTIKSQSTTGGQGKFNEIRFEDKTDQEEIYIHAQKDYNLLVENDVTRTIKHDETVTIENDAKLTVNHDNTITVKNNRTRTVTEGNDKLEVQAGTRTVEVKGKETHTNSDAFEHSVTSDYTLTVGGNLTIEVTGDLTIKAASIKAESTSGAVDLKSALAMNLKAASSLKMEGGASVDIKSSGPLKAEGTMASVKASASGEIDGGGVLTVKGGLVKIN